MEYPEQTKLRKVLEYLHHALNESRAQGNSALPLVLIIRGKKEGIYNTFANEDVSAQLGLSWGETFAWLRRLENEGYIRIGYENISMTLSKIAYVFAGGASLGLIRLPYRERKNSS